MTTLKSYFRSHGFILDDVITSESGHNCELSALSPFLRTLLVMDGTVTKALEAWFWEPVKVVPLYNQIESLAEGKKGLNSKVGDQVLQREVVLQGEETEKIFACARSTVSLECLPVKLSEALKSGEIGIGELFREQGLETYRDIFNINYYERPIQNDVLLSNLEGEIISRSYQIWVNSKPAIIVTEYFPINI